MESKGKIEKSIPELAAAAKVNFVIRIESACSDSGVIAFISIY